MFECFRLLRAWEGCFPDSSDEDLQLSEMYLKDLPHTSEALEEAIFPAASPDLNPENAATVYELKSSIPIIEDALKGTSGLLEDEGELIVRTSTSIPTDMADTALSMPADCEPSRPVSTTTSAFGAPTGSTTRSRTSASLKPAKAKKRPRSELQVAPAAELSNSSVTPCSVGAKADPAVRQIKKKRKEATPTAPPDLQLPALSAIQTTDKPKRSDSDVPTGDSLMPLLMSDHADGTHGKAKSDGTERSKKKKKKKTKTSGRDADDGGDIDEIFAML